MNGEYLQLIKKCDTEIEALKLKQREAWRSLYIPCGECHSHTQVKDAVLGAIESPLGRIPSGQPVVLLQCGHFTLNFNCLDPDLYKKEDDDRRIDDEHQAGPT